MRAEREARGNRRGSRASGCRHSSERSPNAKDCRLRRVRLPKRESGSRCPCSTSSRATSERSLPRSDIAPPRSSPPTRAQLWRSPSVRVPRGSEASSSSRATRRSSSASCRSCRRKSCCTPASRPSRRRASASIPQRGEIWFAGETAEAVWLELEARRRALAAEVEELEARAEAPIPEAAYSAAHDPMTVTLAQLAERLVEALEEIGDDRFEAPLRARADAGASRTGALADELRRLGADEVEVRRLASEAGERLSAVDVERARIEAEADEARRRLEAAEAEPAEGDDRDELADKIERPRAPPRIARSGQSAREAGVRRGEGAPGRALDAAGGPRSEPEGARDAARRPRAHRRGAVRRDVRRRAGELHRSRRDAVPGRRGTASSHRAGGRRASSRASRSSSGRPARR